MSRKQQKLIKGMPSAVLLSILIHVGLFLLAGMLVVFTVVKKEEKQFEPPKAVERPKMKLRKPKVKVKKNSKPKSTARIVTQIQKADMPDIRLPEMGGMGGGLGGGLGGFDMMPDLGEVSMFGAGQSIGNDLVGTFYDFKRDRNGRDIPYSMDQFLKALNKFVQSGWKPSALSRFYRSPKKLYASTIMIPPVLSILAPEAFGEHDTAGFLWVAHYKGPLVCPPSHPDGITFRFWGMGDDIMVVGVGGEVVLNACWPTDFQSINFGKTIEPHWQSSSADSRRYFYGHNYAEVGDWITLEPGVPQEMEAIIGETPGGHFVAMLAVEVEGVEYEKGPQGNPILPIFKTAAPSLDLIETIHENLVPGEVCVTNGPVFCDFQSSGSAPPKWEPEPVEPPVFVESVEPEMRSWSVEEKNVDARFITVIGDKAVLADERGKQRKVPLTRLSDEDRLYVGLARSPKFNIDFSKKSTQRFFAESTIMPDARWLPRHLDYTFSARLKQMSAGEYNHELKVEFFAIGAEIEGDNYILLDRKESRFTPTRANGRSHTFSGDSVGVRDTTVFTERRGQKYGGYLVVVSDERGIIVDSGSSHDWLRDILSNLRQLPEGRHFDKTGARVEPPRPKEIGVY